MLWTRPASLQYLTDDSRRLLVCRQELLTLFSLRLDGVIFVEQLLKQLLFVQLADESVLHNILGVIDEQMHDSFGDLIGSGFTDNVEVGRDESADELGFQGLALGQSWGIRLERLLISISSLTSLLNTTSTYLQCVIILH